MTAPSVFDAWEQHEYCYLITVGRVTGWLHTIEISFVVHEGSAWLLTDPDGRTDWVRDLQHESSDSATSVLLASHSADRSYLRPSFATS